VGDASIAGQGDGRERSHFIGFFGGSYLAGGPSFCSQAPIVYGEAAIRGVQVLLGLSTV
jgi:hypothetical protein